MEKPDLLVCWIKHCDYPLFRALLKKHRDFFGKIVIYFNENNRFPYLDHFMHSAMSDLGNIEFIDQAQMEWGVQDWRDVATNEMLKHSTSQWVCSVEQDWLSRDWDTLLKRTQDAMKIADLVGWYNETSFPYIHPAYWFIKREILEATSRDFGPHSELVGADHFAMVTKEALDKGAKMMPLQDMGFNCQPIPDADCFHLGGINQNYLDFDVRLKAGSLHRPEGFYTYNYFSMKAPVVQSPEFMQLMQRVDVTLRGTGAYAEPETSEWAKFFI